MWALGLQTDGQAGHSARHHPPWPHPAWAKGPTANGWAAISAQPAAAPHPHQTAKIWTVYSVDLDPMVKS